MKKNIDIIVSSCYGELSEVRMIEELQQITTCMSKKGINVTNVISIINSDTHFIKFVIAESNEKRFLSFLKHLQENGCYLKAEKNIEWNPILKCFLVNYELKTKPDVSGQANLLDIAIKIRKAIAKYNKPHLLFNKVTYKCLPTEQ